MTLLHSTMLFSFHAEATGCYWRVIFNLANWDQAVITFSSKWEHGISFRCLTNLLLTMQKKTLVILFFCSIISTSWEIAILFFWVMKNSRMHVPEKLLSKCSVLEEYMKLNINCIAAEHSGTLSSLINRWPAIPPWLLRTILWLAAEEFLPKSRRFQRSLNLLWSS